MTKLTLAIHDEELGPRIRECRIFTPEEVSQQERLKRVKEKVRMSWSSMTRSSSSADWTVTSPILVPMRRGSLSKIAVTRKPCCLSPL